VPTLVNLYCTSLLQLAAENNYTPVVATIATDDKGQALNINADTAAGEVSFVAAGVAGFVVQVERAVSWKPQYTVYLIVVE